MAEWILERVPDSQSLLIDTPIDQMTLVQRAAVRSAAAALTGAAPDRLRDVGSIREACELWAVRAAARSLPSEPALDLKEYRFGEVRLRPVQANDVEVAYLASVALVDGPRWRYRGATPSLETFRAEFYQGVLTQFVVERLGGGASGHVAAYRHDPANGHCYVAFQRWDSASRAGEMIVGLALLLQYLFDNWALRHVYAELPSYNRSIVAGLESLVESEGTLREHTFHQGTWWDLDIVRISRTAWVAYSQLWVGDQPVRPDDLLRQ